MIVGYARVSTAAQNEGLQSDALNREGCERLYVDRCSGARASRPELDRMLDALRSGDTVVVWKLDRLGRSVGNLVDLMNRFQPADDAVEFAGEQLLYQRGRNALDQPQTGQTSGAFLPMTRCPQTRHSHMASSPFSKTFCIWTFLSSAR